VKRIWHTASLDSLYFPPSLAVGAAYAGRAGQRKAFYPASRRGIPPIPGYLDEVKVQPTVKGEDEAETAVG